MKIIKLRFSNLNSLAGEWFFDFTHPDYISGGLFAITGPTGAGKTTILDAICLALYGSTPRLDKISQSSNEIMSRSRAECLAEVTFETPAGRFRCLWSQRRSRQKAGGKLQSARHEIVDDSSGRVIECQLSKTQAEVEKITGMNFGQFTRSMMLAQGAFAAFLEAPVDERAELLEQITGSAIYSDISIRVHKRLVLEKEKLQELKSGLPGLQMTLAEEAALVAQKKDTEREVASLNHKWEEQSQLIGRLENIASIKNDLFKLNEREKILNGEDELFVSKNLALEKGEKALSVNPIFELLNLRQNDLRQAENELKKRQSETLMGEEAVKQAAKLANKAEEGLLQAKAREAAKAPGIARARELDVEIREKELRLKELERQRLDKRKELCAVIKLKPGDPEDKDEALAGRITGIEARRNERQKNHDLLLAQLKETLGGRDVSAWRAKLAAHESRLRELEKLLSLQDELAQNSAELNANQSRRDKAKADFDRSSQHFKLETERLEALEKDGRRLSEILAQSKQSRSLKNHRSSLKKGEPCPLCGSLSHPWADPDTPPPDNAAEADFNENSKLCQAQRELINRLTAQQSAFGQLFKSEGEAGLKLKTKEEKLLKAAGQKGGELGLDPALYPDAARTRPFFIEQRQNCVKIQQTVKKAEDLTGELANEKEKIQQAAEAAINGPKLLKEYEYLKLSFITIQTNREKLGNTRREALGELAPEAEEKRLKSEAMAAEKILSEARRALEKATGELKSNQSLIEDISNRLKGHKAKAEDASKDFQAALASAGFGGEEDWAAARLTEAELNELKKTAGDLKEKRLALKTSRKDLQARLAQEKETPLQQSPEELKDLNKEIDEKRQELQKGLGALNQKLNDFHQAAERHRQISAEIERQEREKNRWDKLESLIGSADGKKFRNFAQGLTFEILTGLANEQLMTLSDRYALIRDSAQPLKLNVMDNYQAGEKRSTKNLSGGESFIVSLALALGLSQMASRRVRVDSLFLDEGFGTLDEDSLETVLEALACLREEGKLIGLISHIPALTARIAVQIKVKPLGGAISSVSGPGVSSADLP